MSRSIESCAQGASSYHERFAANFPHAIENARSHEGGSAPTVSFTLAKFPPPELARRAKSPPAVTPARLSIIPHHLWGYFCSREHDLHVDTYYITKRKT